jgi:hypothetical protein
MPAALASFVRRMPPARRKTVVALDAGDFGIRELDGVRRIWSESATDIDKCSIYDPVLQMIFAESLRSSPAKLAV